MATDTAARHVLRWMRRHVDGQRVSIRDVSADYAQINLQGPAARSVLEAVASFDVSADAFEFRDAAEFEIEGRRVICTRITYVGELGYEIFVGADDAVAVHDAIAAAGRPSGLRHAGLKALSSLRLEKAYRDYGHDMDNTDSIVDVGLSWAVDLEKGHFVGRDAAARLMEAGPPQRRLVQVKLDDPDPLMFHGEVLLAGDMPVGYMRAASYGWTLGGAVGLAMLESDRPVTADYLSGMEWQVDVAGVRYPATVSLRPLYDPQATRVHM